jgi:glycosyltransferase involved in cell wall biosynthesis
MNAQIPTVLVNLGELDPPRNGGMSRVAHIVSDLLVEHHAAGRMNVYFAVGSRFATLFHEWIGHSGLQLIPLLPDEGFSPLFDHLHPNLIVSPLFGRFPFWGEKNPYPEVPHLVSMPDALALDMPELLSPAEAEERRRRYEDLRQASVVVTLSQHALERLRHHLGLRSDQVEVIPLAGDIYQGSLPPLMPEVKPPYVFYPANGWPHKRHDLLFQAMNLVWKSRPDLRLVLCGWFPEERLKYLMQHYTVPSEKVIYLDHVGDSAQMVTLYKNAEALLFTSAHEGFGMPILEAMQAGCPVICAPRTSIPEVAGNAALYVEDDAEPQAWADALLIRLPEKREELIGQGIQQVQRFSWEQVRLGWQHLIQRYSGNLDNSTLAEHFIVDKSDLLLRELQWWAARYDHLWKQTVEKEEVINEQKAVMAKQEEIVQAFGSSFRFWLRYGPLTRYRLFDWLTSQAQRVRRFFFPRLISPKDQYPPRSVFIPTYYRVPQNLGSDSLPIISMVTPSFNQAKFLRHTIESVLGQGYPKLEYVVQDGGSEDGTIEILEQYRPHLTRAESHKDGGQANAINLGFAHASGEIMAYLNSDDLLLPGALHYVARYFERHPEVDVIYGHRVIINEEGKEIGRWVLPPHDDRTQLWLDFVPQETLFWRRRIWEKVGGCIDESYQFAMDWELFLRFVKAGAQIRRVPRFLGAFRSHPQQKTSARMDDLGIQEMNRVREKYLGRTVTQTEVESAIKPYLRLSLVYDALYHLGLLRY